MLILTNSVVGRLDHGACAVAESVRARGGTIDLIGATELVAARWSHSIREGVAATTILLRDGRRVDSEHVGAVLNLIPALPELGFDAAGDRDRAYAQGEQQALFVSFLAGLGDQLIGGVDGQGPAGMWSWARWASLAHRCGMPTAVGSFDSTAPTVSNPVAVFGAGVRQVKVVGERVYGAPSQVFATRCRRLSALSGCELLNLVVGGGRSPELLQACPFPPLTADIADAVADLLLARNARSDRTREAS